MFSPGLSSPNWNNAGAHVQQAIPMQEYGNNAGNGVIWQPRDDNSLGSFGPAVVADNSMPPVQHAYDNAM